MTEQAAVLWRTLEFRTPAMLHAVHRLTDAQFAWAPPNGASSVAWLLWHIAEVEDNWVRDKLLALDRRYPFGASVKATAPSARPSRAELLEYFGEVRALSRARLESTTDAELARPVADEHFGQLTARDVWVGVATSCAWHGGQIVMLANRFVPP